MKTRKELIKQMEFIVTLTNRLLEDVKNDKDGAWHEIRPTKWGNDAIRIRRELNEFNHMMRWEYG